MNANARPRVGAGHDSDTSAAPLAHSPPMPSPRQTRNVASCQRFLDKPQSAVKIEYRRTLAIKARLRPYRSANTPNTNPPTAAATSVMEPSAPPCSFVRFRSAMIEASRSENNITSNASSIQPSEAAMNARCARSSADRHQPKSGTSGRSDRFDRDPCGFESGADGRGEPIRARRVAVDAHRVGVDVKPRSVDGHDRAIRDQADRARHDGVHVVNHRAGLLSRRELTVRFVARDRQTPRSRRASRAPAPRSPSRNRATRRGAAIDRMPRRRARAPRRAGDPGRPC